MGRSGVSGPFQGGYLSFDYLFSLAQSQTDQIFGLPVLPQGLSQFRICEVDFLQLSGPAAVTNFKFRVIPSANPIVIGATNLLAADVTAVTIGTLAICKPTGDTTPSAGGGQDLVAAQRTRAAGDMIGVSVTTPANAGTYFVAATIYGYIVATGEAKQIQWINRAAGDDQGSLD